MAINYRRNIGITKIGNLFCGLYPGGRMIILLIAISLIVFQAQAQTKTDKKITADKKAIPEKRSSSEKKDLFENAEFLF